MRHATHVEEFAEGICFAEGLQKVRSSAEAWRRNVTFRTCLLKLIFLCAPILAEANLVKSTAEGLWKQMMKAKCPEVRERDLLARCKDVEGSAEARKMSNQV